MLYKLGKSGQTFDSVEPLPFSGLPLEKELEDLLAQNFWDVLFESSPLMPIFQERPWQPEADIYALNKEGDLTIFELKRAHADGGAVHQALRYCERAGRFGFAKLEEMFRTYRDGKPVNLQLEHQSGFALEHPLDRSAFNKRQNLIIVGSAGDEELVRNVDYWKSKGISISFVPYRVYQIAGDSYFEFFSLPYDQHSNPADTKGVMFDTNLSYNEDDIWYMCENDRVAAFGGIKGVVYSLQKGDTVFLYHKGYDIVAGGEVKSDVKEDAPKDALYCDLRWLTPKPTRGQPIKAMSASEIQALLDCGFFWARTIKVPYLNVEETKKLLEVLKLRLT